MWDVGGSLTIKGDHDDEALMDECSSDDGENRMLTLGAVASEEVYKLASVRNRHAENSPGIRVRALVVPVVHTCNVGR